MPPSKIGRTFSVRRRTTFCTATFTMLGRRALPRINNALKALSRPASTSTTSAAAIKANDAAISNEKKGDLTLQQSPNFATTWSTAQNPRPGPGSGPRFEQTDMALQPNPLSAMELVAQEPIRLVQGRKAVCDGGSSRTPVLIQCSCSILLAHLISFGNRRRSVGSPQNLHQLGELLLSVNEKALRRFTVAIAAVALLHLCLSHLGY